METLVKANRKIRIPSKDMYSPTIALYGRLAYISNLDDWNATIIIIIEINVNNKLSNTEDSLNWEANKKEEI
ncbi:hypothetical protein [Methanobrevibacter sp.]|uniref:hypothetical protein n=1 Tax=Methanobrevibacter sp. TaxID=66852 RepID=UPI00388FD6DF